MKSGMISASMMCSGLIDLKKTLRIFEESHVEYLHIDVMDGEFVPNFGLGVDYIRGLRDLTSIPLDLHLMIRNPEYKLEWIGIQKTDIVSVHYESTHHAQRTLDRLKSYGCKRFLAINPATPVLMLEDLLDSVDGINLLMVNPGFSGQPVVPGAMRKAERLQIFLRENGRENITVEVDGNITPERARELRKYGAGLFVAGTSSVFQGDIDLYSRNIQTLRTAIA